MNHHEAKKYALNLSCFTTPSHAILSIIHTDAILDTMWKLYGNARRVLCLSAWKRHQVTIQFTLQSKISTTFYAKKYITYKHTFKYNNDTWKCLTLFVYSWNWLFEGLQNPDFHFVCWRIKIECLMRTMYFKIVNQSLLSLFKIWIKKSIISLRYGPISIFPIYQFRFMTNTTFSDFGKITK